MKNTYYAIIKGTYDYYKTKAKTLSEAMAEFRVRFCNNYLIFHSEDGSTPFGTYVNRYYARKAASGDEITVKVEGGYKNMSYSEYNTWRKQKWTDINYIKYQ